MTTKEKLICLMLSIFQLLQAQSSKSEEIRFLDFTPVIDGKLDDKLISLQKKEFNHFFQFPLSIASSIF